MKTPENEDRDSRLRGRTALVTGGARRIGRAIALALGRAGVNVIVHYGHSAREAEDTANEIRAMGVRVWTLRADLNSTAEAEGLFARAAEAIDILVNNASIFPQGRITDVTAENLAENMRVNAFAPLALSRAFAAQGRPGHILNLLDARIADYDREHAAYHLSKRTLFALTRMMAVEFAPLVAVNAIAPGLILPPPGESDAYLERLAHTNPLQRHGSVEEVAEAALFLLSSEFITGQVLFIDGGRFLDGNMYGL